MNTKTVALAVVGVAVIGLTVFGLFFSQPAADPALALAAPAGEAAPAIPPELTAALTGLVAFAVTQGLKSLSAFLSQYEWLSWIKIDGWGSVITGFAMTGFLFYAKIALGLVPIQYLVFVPLLFQFLIGLLSAFGSYATVKTLAKG